MSPEGSVTASPNVSSSFLGDTQTFTCSAMGGPGNTFLWTRLSDGVTVGNMSSLTVSVEGAGDSGMYRCEVTNLAGSDSSVVTLNGEDCLKVTDNTNSMSQYTVYCRLAVVCVCV